MYRVAVITASDRGYAGLREDLSGPAAAKIAGENGFEVVRRIILPDEEGMIRAELTRICDLDEADLILTTGGTGFSPRDRTPEATLAAGERQVPGIPEAMRMNGLQYSPRSMLSRAVSVIRKRTLIVNLPGSPRAVEENLGFVIGVLRHALDMLRGEGSADCARQADS
jgi:molybdenum cofactor synthesis domain-containing protein